MAKRLTKCHIRSSLLMLMFSALAWSGPHFADEADEGAHVPKPRTSTAYAHARIMFRQSNFDAALLLLGEKPQGRDALWLKAESLFRLQRYDAARAAFKDLLALERDTLEQQKIAIRIFDTELLSAHLDAALKSYNEYFARYKKPSETMKYGLAKALYDKGRFKDALPLLNAIEAGNEFGMRARFLAAAIKLDSESLDELIKRFAAIEAMTPVSVEDYGVRQLAILAQARLWADNNRYQEAKDAYHRVNLSSPFGKEATAELIRMMLVRADAAQFAQGELKDASPEYRESQQKKFLQEGQNAMASYRKVHEVGFKDPELLTLMAVLLVKSKRYDDARLAYGELIEHYRPLEEEMRAPAHASKLWPFFRLNFDALPGSIAKESLVPGVPQAFLDNISGLSALRTLKRRIEADGQKLRELEYKAGLAAKSSAVLNEAKKNQQTIIAAYEQLVLEKQKKLASQSAKAINRLLAEAEFRRAELPLLYKRDLKKQEDAIRGFQSTTIEQFERDIKAMNKGGSS